MTASREFFLLSADDASPVDELEASDRDREFSAMMYYITWGFFPEEHRHGFWAQNSDGTPQPRAKAIVPDDIPVHTATTGRKLREPERSQELEKRESAYGVLPAAAHKNMQPKTLRPHLPSTLRKPLQNRVERALDQGSLDMQPQHFTMEVEVAKTAGKARAMAVEKTSGVMRYLDYVGYKCVIRMNPMEHVYDVRSKRPFCSQDTMERVPRYLPSVGFCQDLVLVLHHVTPARADINRESKPGLRGQ